MPSIRTLIALLTLTLLTSGCAGFAARQSDEERAQAQAVVEQMAAKRAGYQAAAALFEAKVESRGKLKLWPSFTAILRYEAPDQLTVTGYSDLGLPLFDYHTADGQYTLTLTGADGPLNGKLNNPRDPAARLLGQLSHLLDGAIGINLADNRLIRTQDGGWQSEDGTRFYLKDGQITRLELGRGRGKRSHITYADFRPSGSVTVPHKMTVALLPFDIHLTISVMEWNLAPA